MTIARTSNVTTRATPLAAAAICALALVSLVPASPALGSSPEELQAVYEQTLRPFDGESVREVDPESMVMACGLRANPILK